MSTFSTGSSRFSRRRRECASTVVSRRARTPTTTSSSELDDGHYEGIIVETAETHLAHWLHVDLPQRLVRLGYPLTTVGADA